MNILNKLIDVDEEKQQILLIIDEIKNKQIDDLVRKGILYKKSGNFKECQVLLQKSFNINEIKTKHFINI